MAVNIPNLGAIQHMGAQFTHNIFAGTAKKLQAQTKRTVRIQQRTKPDTQMPEQPPKTMSEAPPGTGPLGPNAAATGRARRQARAQGQPMPGPRTSQSSGKAPFSTPNRSQSSGKTPVFGPPKPTHAPTVGQVPTQFSNVQTSTPKPANIFRSDATHATPKFSSSQGTAVSATPSVKPAINPFQVNRISRPSGPAATPKQAPSSLQFSNTSTKDNSPFPTHVHPAGSSNAILPTLSANETAKTGRPNEFTVGSRKPGRSVQGLGAMGSKLEESLMNKPLGTPEQKRRI